MDASPGSLAPDCRHFLAPSHRPSRNAGLSVSRMAAIATRSVLDADNPALDDQGQGSARLVSIPRAAGGGARRGRRGCAAQARPA